MGSVFTRDSELKASLSSGSARAMTSLIEGSKYGLPLPMTDDSLSQAEKRSCKKMEVIETAKPSCSSDKCMLYSNTCNPKTIVGLTGIGVGLSSILALL